MESLASLYHQHVVTLQQRTQAALERDHLDALLIHSGELITLFLDDHDYPFKVNPHFKAWLPVTQVPNCWLWVDGVNKPRLWFYSPVDFWHSVSSLPDSFWTKEFDIQVLREADDIGHALPVARQNVGYIGSATQRATELGIIPELINPQGVLNYLHYYRAYKTDYELACMREAQKTAVSGHRAALEAFQSGMSEFDINLAYLTATGHRDSDVPYDNIVALNEHAAVLHYTQLKHHVPGEVRSFLIDAGAQYNGYAADITRSYAAQHDGDFAALVKDLNHEQRALIDTMKSGVRYTEYHEQMHRRLAGLLKRHKLVGGLSEEAMVEQGMTRPFLPHGLGHLLGLQVHDVGGFMQDDTGTTLAAPECYPYLRCTRILEPRMVVTIEPGLYFIDSLLEPWRAGALRQHFNWQKIDALRPAGGIRIEDNVVIHDKRIENLTRALNLD